MINKFIIEDVRCFADKQELEIRPLTLLVGENSTGKSTVLGCYQAISDFFSEDYPAGIDFNRLPYQMGAFANIVRKETSALEKFVLGFVIRYGKQDKSSCQILVTFAEKKGSSEPIIDSVKYIFHDGEIEIIREPHKKDSPFSSIHFSIKETEKSKFTITTSERGFGYIASDISFLSHLLTNKEQLRWFQDELKQDGKKAASGEATEALSTFLKKHGVDDTSPQRMEMEMEKTYSIGPIRSEPKRTYNPTNETVTSDGSEVPMLLGNLKMSDKRMWKQLKTALVAFGKASGLFTDIEVKKFSRSASDPFQLEIKVRGIKANLMDVGYGISQVLPILVRILTAQHDSTFLIQQPEVHLHPKGQAELTSLLISLINTNKNSFIIETHSDYMIDRARIEIMRGNISPDDVSLIYLQPTGNKVKVHNISFDRQANMLGVPQGYRDFFMKESDTLLGFED